MKISVQKQPRSPSKGLYMIRYTSEQQMSLDVPCCFMGGWILEIARSSWALLLNAFRTWVCGQ